MGSTGTISIPSPAGNRVQSVDRAMTLLKAVADASGAETTTVRIAARCGLNRATAWRLLSTLEGHGLVACDRTTGRWRIGLGLAAIARSAGLDGFRATMRVSLERLSEVSGETAAFAVVTTEGLTYVDEVTPAAIVSAAWKGRTVPLHATSTGKVLIATRGELVPEPAALVRFTDTTIVSPAVLEAELAEIRVRGYAVCRGEFEPSAWGVSSLVVDADGRPAAVLSLWGPANRITENRFEALGALVLEESRRLAEVV